MNSNDQFLELRKYAVEHCHDINPARHDDTDGTFAAFFMHCRSVKHWTPWEVEEWFNTNRDCHIIRYGFSCSGIELQQMIADDTEFVDMFKKSASDEEIQVFWNSLTQLFRFDEDDDDSAEEEEDVVSIVDGTVAVQYDDVKKKRARCHE